jgi:hypothetical protein
MYREPRVLAVAVALLLATALSANACASAKGVMKVALREAAPIVRTIPDGASDAALALAAGKQLEASGLTPSALQAARQLVSEVDVKDVVNVVCNFSGLSDMKFSDVVSEFGVIVSYTEQYSNMAQLYEDANTVIYSQSNIYVDLMPEGQLAVAVFQQIYC